jgi:hypothetical protein
LVGLGVYASLIGICDCSRAERRIRLADVIHSLGEQLGNPGDSGRMGLDILLLLRA